MITDTAQSITDDGADAAEMTETVTAIGAISMLAPPSPTQLDPIPTPVEQIKFSRIPTSFRKIAK